MKHRSIDFDIEEAAPQKWRWKIYPKIEDAPRIIGEELFDSRTSAIEACLTEIVRIEPAILALCRRPRASLRRPHLVSGFEPSSRTRVRSLPTPCEFPYRPQDD
jgi:hypothetical protein